MTYPQSVSRGDFDVAALLRSAFDLLHRAPGPFLALAAIPLIPRLMEVLTVHGPPTGGAAVFSGIASIAAFVLAVLIQGAMLHMAYGVIRGRTVSLDEAFSKGLARFWPLLGVALLSTLLIVVGLILLVVPGIWLSCILFASAAVCVVETQGVTDSMKRSAELTIGYRWKVFALGLVLVLGAMLAGAVVSGIGFMVGGSLLARLLDLALSLYITAYASVLLALAYFALRSAKENASIEHAYDVFD